jgi:hypothetical protein
MNFDFELTTDFHFEFHVQLLVACKSCTQLMCKYEMVLAANRTLHAAHSLRQLAANRTLHAAHSLRQLMQGSCRHGPCKGPRPGTDLANASGVPAGLSMQAACRHGPCKAAHPGTDPAIASSVPSGRSMQAACRHGPCKAAHPGTALADARSGPTPLPLAKTVH